MTNTRIWDALGKTDPKHTKPFKRAGGFSGTAMRPIWTIKRLTEQFGPAGLGWGMLEPKFDVVNAGDEILVFCTIALWYIEQADKRGLVYGVGGDKVLGKNKYGPFTNDEAFKASYTDALSNAMKQIGVGADIHMGLFDDEKYVRETEREFNAKPQTDAAKAKEFEPDEDAKDRARGWLSEERGALNMMHLAEDVKDWKRRKAKALVKMEATWPDLHQQIMDAYEVALDRVTERV